MMDCLFCGGQTLECGKFVTDSRGRVRHVGPCCIDLAKSIHDPIDDIQHKYATST